MEMVQAVGLTKYYGQYAAVNGIDFSVIRGEFCGILGPNGAGKTTTLQMLIGSTPPSSGTLQVLGYAIPAQAREMRRLMGIVPQRDNLDPDFTVAENLAVYGSYFGLDQAVIQARIPQLLAFASLEQRGEAFVPMLSGGMQRRLSVARALINQPQLLILDEPTTGLDPQARQLIWQRLRQLKQEGLTMILTTHYMEEAERLCDRIIVMDQGRILDTGSPRALIEKHIEPYVIEIHGSSAADWHEERGARLALRCEHVGDTWFYYTRHLAELKSSLEEWGAPLHYLHRPATLEDVFLKLTGRDLRDG